MIRWIDESPVRWIEHGGQIGQSEPATAGQVTQGFSNAEKILMASVAISAIGLAVHLWEIFGRKHTDVGT